MLIKNFRIKNHKSFIDSGKLGFSSGINIIVGKNNSGKSALLESFTIEGFSGHPHRSSKVLPKESSPQNHFTDVDVEYSIDGSEIFDHLLNSDQGGSFPLLDGTYYKGRNPEDYRLILDQYFTSKNVPIFHSITKNLGGNSINYSHEPCIRLFQPPYTNGGKTFASAHLVRRKDFSGYNIVQIYPEQDSNQDIGAQIGPKLSRRIYKFDAERLKIGICNVGHSTTLKPDASNLPEVLNNLHNNKPKLYQTYNDYIRQIFPEIKFVGVKNIPGSKIEIFVQTDEDERLDLTFQLSECGTGLSQALAILYVALSEREPRVIIIDEPNSFLHPGATKSLLGILSTFSQHQYIISSHSAEVFKVPGVSTLKLVSKIDGVSQVKELNYQQVEETKECLLELGIEISDILSSDQNVWVEGPTEKHCFPLILRKTSEWKDFTTSFMPVKNTGDFDGKRSKLAIDIYKRMTEGNLVLPSRTCFIFDREERSSTEIQDFERMGVKFIPRKMYENYLVHVDAISEVLRTEGYEVDLREVVQDWISQHKANWESDKRNDNRDFNKDVNGAKLLSELFSNITGTKTEYNKILHGKRLTEWILEHDPTHFEELSSFLQSIVS